MLLWIKVRQLLFLVPSELHFRMLNFINLLFWINNKFATLTDMWLGTKTHSDVRPDSGNNNLTEKFEQLTDIIDKQRPFHVKSSATLFGCMNPLENKLEGKPLEHKLNAGKKVSEEVEINKFLAPGDTFSPQSSGCQKYSDNDSYDGRSEPVSSICWIFMFSILGFGYLFF